MSSPLFRLTFRYNCPTMKSRLTAVFLLVLLVLTEAYPASDHHSRQKRGFKASVSQRIGHGFGKRKAADYDPLLLDQSRQLMTNEELAGRLSTNKRLAEIIVQKFLDKNGNGLISTDELFNGSNGL